MSHDTSMLESGQCSEGLPPQSNTGVTDSVYGEKCGEWAGIDYLTFTLDGDLSLAEVSPESVGVEIRAQLVGAVKQNYDQSWELYPAGMLYHHSKRAVQGWHFEFKGSDLRVLRESGVSDVGLLKWVVESGSLGARISRLDLALDFFGGGASVQSLHDAMERGDMVTRLSDKWIDSRAADGSRAWTVYLGSPASDKRLVVYDKGREQGQLQRDWTRVELRVKKRLAMSVSQGVVMGGVVPVIAELATRSVEFRGTWWLERFERAGELLVGPVPRKETNTSGWVSGTAIPGALDYLSKEFDQYTFMELLYGVLTLANGRYRSAVERDMEALRSIRRAGLG